MYKEFIDYNKIPGEICRERNFKAENPFFTFFTVLSSSSKLNTSTVNSILNQTYRDFKWIVFCNKEIEEDVKTFFKSNYGNEPRILISTIDQTNNKLIDIKNSIETRWSIPINMQTFIDKTLLEVFYTSLSVHDVDVLYTNVIDISNKVAHRDSLLSQRKKLICFPTDTYCLKTDLIPFISPNGFVNKKNVDFLHLNFYGVWQKNVEVHKIKIDGKYVNFPMSSLYNHNSGPNKVKFDLSIDDSDKAILCMMPWAKIGGADSFNINILTNLKNNGYKIYVISTEVSLYESRQNMESAVDAFYDLTTFLDRSYWANFIHDLIIAKNIKLVFQLSSLYGYHVIPWLKYKFPEIPFIDYLHAEDFSWRDGGFPKDSTAISDLLEITYTCNGHLKNLMMDRMNRQIDNVKTLYIGVNTEKYDPDSIKITDKLTEEFCKNKKVVLFPSRFSYEKRPIFVLYVIKKLIEERSDVVCLMVGGGPAENDMKKYIVKLDLQSKVKLIPMKQSIEEYYKMADVTIIASLSEGITLTTYESLAMNVPVISSDVGGQSEVVKKEVGIIIKPYQNIANDLYNFNYSEEEISEYSLAIEKIIDDKDKYCKNNNCRNYIVDKFSQKKLYDTLTKELSEYMKNGSKIKIDYTEEFAVRYLVLFNETTKEYYNNSLGYDNFKENLRNKLWKHWWWRSAVKTGKKLKIDKFIKRVYFKEK